MFNTTDSTTNRTAMIFVARIRVPIGRQQTRTAAVLKEQMKDQMLYDYVPQMKSALEAYMTPGEKMNYIPLSPPTQVRCKVYSRINCDSIRYCI